MWYIAWCSTHSSHSTNCLSAGTHNSIIMCQLHHGHSACLAYIVNWECCTTSIQTPNTEDNCNLTCDLQVFSNWLHIVHVGHSYQCKWQNFSGRRGSNSNLWHSAQALRMRHADSEISPCKCNPEIPELQVFKETWSFASSDHIICSKWPHAKCKLKNHVCSCRTLWPAQQVVGEAGIKIKLKLEDPILFINEWKHLGGRREKGNQ